MGDLCAVGGLISLAATSKQLLVMLSSQVGLGLLSFAYLLAQELNHTHSMVTHEINSFLLHLRYYESIRDLYLPSSVLG